MYRAVSRPGSKAAIQLPKVRNRGESGTAPGKNISQILDALELRAPQGASEDWDNTGLLVGDPADTTSGAIVANDLTDGALELARRRGYRLIVTHHPCIFPKSKGLARVVADSRGGPCPAAIIYRAIQAGISVISVHTNFDQCALEVVSDVAGGLDIQPLGRLIDKPARSLLKLVVFVPETHVETVRAALAAAGAGHIGRYDSCSFGVAGTGTFRGLEGANPFIGKARSLEKIAEIRLETILPRGLKKPVLAALKESHPYEEVAYDLSIVEQAPASQGLIRGLGYGFWGDFARPRSFSALTRGVKALFKVDGFWVGNPVPKKVRRLAFVAGNGGSFLEAAAAQGCELFITGEVGYHSVLEGARLGLTVLELGHRESERFFASTMQTWLQAEGLRVAIHREAAQKILGGSP